VDPACLGVSSGVFVGAVHRDLVWIRRASIGVATVESEDIIRDAADLVLNGRADLNTLVAALMELREMTLRNKTKCLVS